MFRKLLYYSAISCLIIGGLTSCSREYHLDFAGRYHPETKKLTPASTEQSSVPKEQEEIIPLSNESGEQSFASSFKTDPVIIVAPKKDVGLTPPSAISLKQIKEAKKIIKSVKKINESNTGSKGENLFPAKEMTNNSSEVRSNSAGADALLCAIIAFFIPPLGVALYEADITAHFWIDLILTLLFWLPGFIYALIVILG